MRCGCPVPVWCHAACCFCPLRRFPLFAFPVLSLVVAGSCCYSESDALRVCLVLLLHLMMSSCPWLPLSPRTSLVVVGFLSVCLPACLPACVSHLRACSPFVPLPSCTRTDCEGLHRGRPSCAGAQQQHPLLHVPSAASEAEPERRTVRWCVYCCTAVTTLSRRRTTSLHPPGSNTVPLMRCSRHWTPLALSLGWCCRCLADGSDGISLHRASKAQRKDRQSRGAHRGVDQHHQRGQGQPAQQPPAHVRAQEVHPAVGKHRLCSAVDFGASQSLGREGDGGG
jgi:hypothetical protein